MGNRDIKKEKKKKPAKDLKKISPLINSNVISAPPEVEVIRRGKKKKEDWEEE